MSWGSLTTEEVDRIEYLVGHLIDGMDLNPDSPYAAASIEHALDGFDELKQQWGGGR